MVNATFTVEERVGYITIEREEALNSIDMDTKIAIIDTLEDYRDRDEVRVIVFQSAGDRAFSAGGDLQEVVDKDYALEPFTESWEELFTTMLRLGKPTLAKVDGYTFGGGFDLILHTDIVVASEDAIFGQPEANLGIINHFSPALLPRVVGLRKTLELLLTGEPISATEAERIGLINHAVPTDELDDVVNELVQNLVAKHPEVLKRLKEAVYTSLEMNPTAARDHIEEIALETARTEPWMREGVDAQLEGRDPEWDR